MTLVILVSLKAKELSQNGVTNPFRSDSIVFRTLVCACVSLTTDVMLNFAAIETVTCERTFTNE